MISKIEYNKQAYNRIMQRLQKTANDCNDLTPVWNEFKEWYPSFVVKPAFESMGKGIIGKWASYTTAYKKIRKSKGLKYGKVDLQVSGELYKDALNPETKVTKKQLTFIVNNKLAAIHQLTKRRRNDGQPRQRPFFVNADGTLPKRSIQYLMLTIKKHIALGSVTNG